MDIVQEILLTVILLSSEEQLGETEGLVVV